MRTRERDETGDDAETEAEDEPEDADDHLSDVPDGAGCTEIWEHLAERREAETADDA